MDAGHSIAAITSIPLSPQLSTSSSNSSSTTTTLHPVCGAYDHSDDIEQEEEGNSTPTVTSRPYTSPIISHLGPISPIEELTPAIVQATSSPRRRHLSPTIGSATAEVQSNSISASSSITKAQLDTTSSSSNNSSSTAKTCTLILDWSRPRTAGAIFHSSSGVSRVQLAVRPAAARAQASIERLKWASSSSLHYQPIPKRNTATGGHTSATAVIPPSPTRDIKASKSGHSAQIPSLPGAPLFTTVEADLV